VRIAKLKRQFEINVKWIHFPLHPDTPAEGRTMEQIYAGRDIDPQSAHLRMKALMNVEGLPYGKRTHSYNSRLAQELGKWADTQQDGDALHDAIYRAYFVDTHNISDPNILLEIVASAGFSVDAAREVLNSRSFRTQIDADWEKSRQYGVTGVPTFVAGGYGVVGAQPYETLEQLLNKVIAKITLRYKLSEAD
jgi:predicted DsbA family dithiol-disulfide isomerase